MVPIKTFDLTLKLQGFPIHEASKELQKIKSFSPDELKVFQGKMGWDIFNFHLKFNQEYHDFVGKGNVKMWEDIPILTKRSIQKPVSERFTKGFNSGNTHLHNTSGSSGEPFYFAKDKYCHAMTWAVIKDRFGQHDIDFNSSLQARFYGIPLDSKIKYYKEKLKDFLSHRVRFPVFNLSDGTLHQYLNRFRKIKFQYLNGYTSSLVLFADFLTRNNIVLKEVCPTLTRCITTSEVCDAIDRKKLEKGFGVPVVNEYGAAELDLIAFENKEFEWEVNNQTLLVEVIDENGKSLPFGEEGRFIITSLYNKAMPFIRYEVGDYGSISLNDLGKPILEKLVGRTNDIAIFPSGRRVPGLTFYYVSKGLLEKGGKIKEFVILQKSDDHFHFDYVSDEELDEEDKKAVENMMIKYLNENLNISFQRKEFLNRTKAGKLKHFSVEF